MLIFRKKNVLTDYRLAFQSMKIIYSPRLRLLLTLIAVCILHTRHVFVLAVTKAM